MDRAFLDRHLDIIRQLSPTDQHAVSRFAEFLLSQSAVSASVPAQPPQSVPVQIPEPESVPRPSDEKVVAAVKRLSQTYFMLDKSKMLGVTSDLVTQHILQGRDAVEVIDELERVFAEHYQALKQNGG